MIEVAGRAHAAVAIRRPGHDAVVVVRRTPGRRVGPDVPGPRVVVGRAAPDPIRVVGGLAMVATPEVVVVVGVPSRVDAHAAGAPERRAGVDRDPGPPTATVRAEAQADPVVQSGADPESQREALTGHTGGHQGHHERRHRESNPYRTHLSYPPVVESAREKSRDHATVPPGRPTCCESTASVTRP